MAENKIYAYAEDAPSLCEAYKEYFKVGAAINTRNLEEGSPARKTILKQYNVIVPDNEAKPRWVQPEEGRFEFDRVDKIVEFAEKYGMALRGHTLVWHNSCPDWFFYDKDGNEVGADVLIERMKNHITTVVSRYRGRIRTWDVVNEVLQPEGKGFRDTMWYKIAGTRFIKEAFKAAHAADPEARLVINDYNLEQFSEKAELMVDFVAEMLEEGIPVHGVGIQMHRYLEHDLPLETMMDNFRKLLKLREIAPELTLEVTEMDISCFPWSYDESLTFEWTEELLKSYNDQYVAWFKFFKKLAEEGALDSVLFWGIDDGHSWLNGMPVRRHNYPLLIGREYVLKDAFYEVIKAAQK